MSDEYDSPAQRDSTKKPAPWRLIFALVFLAAIAVFAVENNHKVAIRFVGPTVHASLTIALLAAAVLGALATLPIRRHRRHPKN